MNKEAVESNFYKTKVIYILSSLIILVLGIIVSIYVKNNKIHISNVNSN